MLNKEDILALALECSEGSGKRYTFTEESLFDFLEALNKEPPPTQSETNDQLAALSAVTAERGRLRELAYVGEHMHDDYSWKARHAELRADLDELRKDAERYRWLREQDAEDGIAVLPVGRWEMPALLCTTPFDSAGMVDAVVDAAMAAKEENKI